MQLYMRYLKGLKELLMAPAKFPGCSGSRNLHDNISDLRAQVAANQKVSAVVNCDYDHILLLLWLQGITLVTELINSYGLDVVQAYMTYIQVNLQYACELC